MKLVDPVELGYTSFYCESNKSTVKPQAQEPSAKAAKILFPIYFVR